MELPLVNTLILLLSGATITWAHHSVVKGYFLETLYAFTYTVILAISFIIFQAFEYHEALFTIADGIYGATFFVATGFHGLHVIVGSIFLITTIIRIVNLEMDQNKNVHFEVAAWYWHFVDVVWLFLYIFVYVWGTDSKEVFSTLEFMDLVDFYFFKILTATIHTIALPLV